MSLKTDCKCSHDVDTHYKNLGTGKRESCLGRGCDCKCFIDARTPSVPPTQRTPDYVPYQGYVRPKRRPHNDTSCKCNACKRFDAPYVPPVSPLDIGWGVSFPWLNSTFLFDVGNFVRCVCHGELGEVVARQVADGSIPRFAAGQPTYSIRWVKDLSHTYRSRLAESEVVRA